MRTYEKSDTRILIEMQLQLAAKVNHGALPIGIYTELGKAFGLSRQRIEQIARDIEMVGSKDPDVTKKRNEKKCAGCDVVFSPKYKGHKYHSAECRMKTYLKRYYVFIPCAQCATPIKTYKRHVIKGKKYYCNHTCFGKYNGKKYGFGREDYEHLGYVPRTNEEVLQILKNNPFTAQEFQFAFGYSNGGAQMQLSNLRSKKRVRKIGKGTYELIMEEK